MTELERLKEELDAAVAEFKSFINANKVAVEDFVPEEIYETPITDIQPMTRNTENCSFNCLT